MIDLVPSDMQIMIGREYGECGGSLYDKRGNNGQVYMGGI